MTQERLPIPFPDEVLVAWLDNQLSEAQREQVAQRLQSDEVLADRLNQLSYSNLPFHEAYEPLLSEAPIASLQARLDAIPDPVSAPKVANKQGVSRRHLLAAAVSFLAVGIAVGRYAVPFAEPEQDLGWRNLVAEYMSLYSADTLADIHESPEQQQQELQRVNASLGTTLTPDRLALQGATLKNARLLNYDQYNIAQITYLDATHGPMALCITRSSQRSDTAQQSEIRRGMNVIYWRAKGFNYMLIGHNPADQMALRGQILLSALS